MLALAHKNRWTVDTTRVEEQRW